MSKGSDKGHKSSQTSNWDEHIDLGGVSTKDGEKEEEEDGKSLYFLSPFFPSLRWSDRGKEREGMG